MAIYRHLLEREQREPVTSKTTTDRMFFASDSLFQAKIKILENLFIPMSLTALNS